MDNKDRQMVSEERYQELKQQLFEKMTDKVAESEMISNEVMQDARKYALCIVFNVNSYLEFAISMLDYLGEGMAPLCGPLYKELYQTAFTRGHHMDDPQIVDRYNDTDLIIEYQHYKDIEKKKEGEREGNFKENIDELQFLVKQFREKAEFQKMLNFVGKFHYLAPYNAMIVEMQMPGAKFVFPGKQWREYGRRIKPNAQQLITLLPFGPIQCMFDISDTEPIEGIKVKEETELMEMWDGSLKNPSGEIDPTLLNQLIENLPSYGVYLDDSMLAANTYGGYLMEYGQPIFIPINKDHELKVFSCFLISVNHKQTDEEKFHTICHELGHLFCRHQFYNYDKVRRPSQKEREFEAETVAWLVCKRHGITNPSEEYLATFAPEGEIPICSTDLIMRAVTEIEKMLEKKIYASSSMWYAEDKNHKSIVDKERKRLAEQKKKK